MLLEKNLVLCGTHIVLYTCIIPIVLQYLFVNNHDNKIDNTETHLGI